MTTTNDTLVGPGKGVQRDRYGRPLIIAPDGITRPYTRCTTFIDCLDDKSTLAAWKQRQTAIGLANRRDLLAQVKATPDPDSQDGKRTLNRLCDEALESAGGNAKRELGTVLHAICERSDRGEMVEDLIPDGQEATIHAYQDTITTNRLEVVQMETFGVHDDLQVAGTWDRLYRTPGGDTVVGDIKTGSDYSLGKFAMQMAIYARSMAYDPETGERTGLPGVNPSRGLLVHLPEGSGECRLWWLDLDRGWEAVQLAKVVRDYRRIKPDQWRTPYMAGTSQALDAGTGREAHAALLAAIREAHTEEDLYALWEAHQGTWTDEHTAAASKRKTALTAR